MTTMVVPYTINSYTVVAHEAEEGGYWGEVVELPGCVSQGETMEEFRRNIREALEAVLEAEAQVPHIQIYTDPALKDFIQLGIPETWTATG